MNELELKQNIDSLEVYRNFKVINKETLDEAVLIIGKCKKIINVIKNEIFAEQLKKAKEALQAIKDAQDKLIKKPSEILAILENKVKSYNEKLIAEKYEKEKEKADLERFMFDYETSEEKIKEKVASKEKIDGAINVVSWKAELVDLRALLKAILDNNAPIELIEFNQSFANKLAKETKGEKQIDGIKFYVEKQIRFKSL